MARLSVNINKFATLRNARGGNLPDVIKAAKDCERFGAEGITVSSHVLMNGISGTRMYWI
jgi:pyridoxine 5-phosphate synthase